MSKSAISFIAAIFGASHMSVVSTMPPPCSSVLPFSRTVIVMTTSCVSKPLIVFFWPVFLTSKSTSHLLLVLDARLRLLGLRFACSFRASSSAFFCASSIWRRSSANVVTL